MEAHINSENPFIGQRNEENEHQDEGGFYSAGFTEDEKYDENYGDGGISVNLMAQHRGSPESRGGVEQKHKTLHKLQKSSEKFIDHLDEDNAQDGLIGFRKSPSQERSRSGSNPRDERKERMLMNNQQETPEKDTKKENNTKLK